MAQINPISTGVQKRKAKLARDMQATRQRTLQLLDAIPDDLLNIRVHDFYSPIGWHFGHIGMTEEFWIQIQALKQPSRNAEYAFLFANLPENPKEYRIHLPPRKVIRRYLSAIRKDTLAALAVTDIAGEDALLADGYAWEFAHQHECQHQETIAEIRYLLAKHTKAKASEFLPEQAEMALRKPEEMEMASLPGGTFQMGSDDRHGYDNEKCAHAVTVAPFALDRTPVTAGQWAQFIEDGGYRRRELWNETGWAWRQAENAALPEYWQRSGRGYGMYNASGLSSLSPHQPVMSLSWFEADAYARWLGKRLPTEAEWEYAARFDPQAGETRLYPWGDSAPATYRADYDQRGQGPQAVLNAHDETSKYQESAFGVRYMAGSVWEWTSTPFQPYPGFQAFPYAGYSKDHFDGAHYVCRGGSWASDARILRASFRNWYVPTYRQGFLGVRCAR